MGKNLLQCFLYLSEIGKFWLILYESKKYKKIVPRDSFIRVERGKHTIF